MEREREKKRVRMNEKIGSRHVKPLMRNSVEKKPAGSCVFVQFMRADSGCT